MSEMIYCRACGTQMHTSATACPKCGAVAVTLAQQVQSKGIVAVVLCLIGFFGLAGLHRFYVGKVGSGVVFLLTCGWFGIGTLIDLIMLLCGAFKDSSGNRLSFRN